MHDINRKENPNICYVAYRNTPNIDLADTMITKTISTLGTNEHLLIRLFQNLMNSRITMIQNELKCY